MCSAEDGKMHEVEELKSFISKQLHAAASEILGAIEKTITIIFLFLST